MGVIRPSGYWSKPELSCIRIEGAGPPILGWRPALDRETAPSRSDDGTPGVSKKETQAYQWNIDTAIIWPSYLFLHQSFAMFSGSTELWHARCTFLAMGAATNGVLVTLRSELRTQGDHTFEGEEKC